MDIIRAVERRTGLQGWEQKGPSGAEEVLATPVFSWTTPSNSLTKTLLLGGNDLLYTAENKIFEGKSFYLLCETKIRRCR